MLVGEVDRSVAGDHVAAAVADPGDRFRRTRRVEVGADDVGAFGGEEQGGRAALSSGRPGDQGDLAVEPAPHHGRRPG